MQGPTINEVEAFWDKNPLLTGELEAEPGTMQWINSFDKIKDDVVRLDLPLWTGRGLIEGKKVLDVGCGPGYWRRKMKDVHLEYFGIDLSGHTVSLARKSAELLGLSGEIIKASAEDIPYSDNFFDHVISEGVIHHTPNTEKCVSEIYRVLKPGGTATISVYYKNIFLSNPLMFWLSKTLMSVFTLHLKGRGREKMWKASSPDEMIRMYDGFENPIGKGYSNSEFLTLLHPFQIKKTRLYYFPLRSNWFISSGFFKIFMDRHFGFMILGHLVK